MDWLLKRSKEASTYGGLALIATALAESFKVREAAPVAEAASEVAQGIAAGVPWWQAAILGAGGLLMAFKSDTDRGW